MTDNDLSRIEATFRNPPSNGMLAELGLEVCAELRIARAEMAAAVAIAQPAFGMKEALETLEIPGPTLTQLRPPDERPTPAHGIDRKKPKK